MATKNPYLFPGLQKESHLTGALGSAAGSLYKKLSSLEVQSLPISGYNHKYLEDHIGMLKGSLQIYTHLLFHCTAILEKPLGDIVFIDYGGGTGLLSMLAREAGYGTVIYNDIYDVSCRDAETIASSLGLKADYYHNGDEKLLGSFLSGQGLQPDCLASSDVIEHVYDTSDFLRTLASYKGLRSMAHNTFANGRNPFVHYRLKLLHRCDENTNRQISYGTKERDSTQSFRELREEIIRANFMDKLAPGQVSELAMATRGLIKKDIIDKISYYLEHGTMAYKPGHPTNTCDPLTGNWSEQVMDPEKLCQILTEEGFHANVFATYYAWTPNRLRQALAPLLNFLIGKMGKHGLLLSPGYMIAAYRDNQ